MPRATCHLQARRSFRILCQASLVSFRELCVVSDLASWRPSTLPLLINSFILITGLFPTSATLSLISYLAPLAPYFAVLLVPTALLRSLCLALIDLDLALALTLDLAVYTYRSALFWIRNRHSISQYLFPRCIVAIPPLPRLASPFVWRQPTLHPRWDRPSGPSTQTHHASS